MKKKRRLKKLNIILFALGLFLVIYSGINIFKWFKDSKNIKNITDNVNDNVIINETDDASKTIDSKNIDKDDPYWKYIKMKLIDVDFSKLKEINSDVVGWIQVNGTNINYPFVHTTNNKYYLAHSLYKEYNRGGWVFLDYRNSTNKLDKNNIIYAHGRLDNIMFGTLKNLLETDWYNNKENHVIKLSRDDGNTLWQVFSVYHIKTTSDYLQVKFNSNSEFKSFANMLQKRSIYKFNTSVNETDKILTLSTCYNENEKMVMHAKLIKYSE